MVITSIELYGFKRVMLSNIKRIQIHFKERLQLILGTNGSGKSSLIGELTPLPADPRDYTKEGYKLIEYLHNGSTYVLKSTMNPEPRHSFKKDGVELNQGGTQSVQKELVAREFGMTTDIRNLLTGKERFTDMSPRRRRDWFTMLSEINYDYALAVYGKFRDRSNEISGALKHAKRRIVAESARVMSDEEQQFLRKEIDLLHYELDILQQERAPLIPHAHDLPRRHQALEHELQELVSRGIRLRTLVFSKIGFESLEAIDTAIENTKHAVIAKRALLDQAYQEHKKLEGSFKILKQTGEEGLTKLQERLAQHRQERNEILARRRLGLEGLDAQAAMSAIASVRDVLVDVFTHLPENRDRRYSMTNYKQLETKKLELQDNKVQLEKGLLKFNSRKNVLDSHKALGTCTCPKCGHGWIQGYSDEEYAQLTEDIQKTHTALDAKETEIVAVANEITAIDNYRIQYGNFSRLVKAWPVLQPFWDVLISNEYVINSPRMALTTLETFEHDLQHDLKAVRIEKDIEGIQGLINQALQLGNENLGDVTKKMGELQGQIEAWTAELTHLNNETQRLGTLKRNVVEFQAIGEKLAEKAQQIQDVTQERVEALRREIIHEEIRELQVALATKSKALSEMELQKKTVTDLEFTINELSEQEQAIKLLMEELSPTDGLIAEGLLGSIQVFVAEMNRLLGKTWTYPLEVKACGVSSDTGTELDYQFPMLVDNEPVADVGKGSKGQKEIVDLAFLIVGMQRLGLVDPPLMLDEFGSGLDETHRRAAAYVIQGLIEENRFSQVFMVSHYEASYGSLTQTEVCVLCPDNITIPNERLYNQHVVIEH